MPDTARPRDPERVGPTRPPVGVAVALAILLQAAASSPVSARDLTASTRFPVIAGRVPASADVRGDPASGTNVLGLQVQPLPPHTPDQTGVLSGQGVVVAVVEQGSTAGMAGVRPGDVIRQVNRQTVRSIGDFERAMGAVARGELVRLWIQRGSTSLLIILEH